MRAMMLLAPGAFVGALCGMPSALAQVSVATVPVATTLPQTSVGDRGGDAGAFSGYHASTPLRLSLEGSVFSKAGMFPNCIALEDDVGNSVGGIPVQHDLELRLTPRLSLSVFTQLGCPIDAGIGGALTYAVPLRKSVQVVFGLGLYGAPGQLPLFRGLQSSFLQGLRGQSSPINEAARVDVVWSTKDGHPYHVGTESLGLGRQGIRFGGGF
jgi:hypothetical protein